MSSEGTPPSRSRYGPPPQPVRQLVRDPNAKLAGVASGVAQHTGVDVSIIRLAFVLFTLVTGVGLLIYIAAWLIVPKAEMWPPVGGRTPTSAVTSRQLAIGAVVVGLAVLIFFGGGSFGETVIPLALIGAGVWLLLQGPADESAVATTAAAVDPLTDSLVDTPFVAPPPELTDDWTGADPSWPPPADPTGFAHSFEPPPAAAPPPRPTRPKRRPIRRLFLALFAIIGGLVALAVGIVAIVVTVGGVEIETQTAIIAPDGVEDLPDAFDFEPGEIVIDLTNLDPASFAGVDRPHEVEINVPVGELEIIVPEDLAVSIEADAGVGDVQLFQQSGSGVAVNLRDIHPDPDLSLEVSIGAGQLTVVEAGSP